MVCAIFSSSTQACSYAYQYSLFPMGASAGQIIFLELELERYVNTPANGAMPMQGFGPHRTQIETRWKGYLRLQALEGDSLNRLAELAYVDISDEDYEAALQPYFQKAMQRAQALPDFELANLKAAAFCRYDRSCTLFQLEVDTLELSLKASFPELNRWQAASFPPVVLHKFENIMQLNFSEMDKVESASRINFYQAWKPYAARRYEIGGRELVLYTLGWGQARGYQGKKEEQWQTNLPPVSEFVEGRDVMMHGQRFDFFQLL